MFKQFLVASLVLGTLSSVATPALALKGIDALDQCVKNSANGCTVSSSPAGDIIIEGGEGGTVFCGSLEAECMVVVEKKAGAPGTPATFQVPESLVQSSGESSGGSGHSFSSGTGGGGRGPLTPGVID